MKIKAAVRNMRLEDIDHVYEIEASSFTSPWTKDSFIMSCWKIRMLIIS